MSPSETVLEARGLWAGYTRPILHDIDLSVGPGAEPVGVIGESGVGKTALVESLTGRLRPMRGAVTWGGRPVHRLGRRERKAFAVAVRTVFQDGHGPQDVDPRLSPRRLVADGLAQARRAGRETGRGPEELLAFVGLEPYLYDRARHQLSGGQRQRLALAVALSAGPEVLILDEPVTALDHGLKAWLVERLSRLVAERGMGLLVVSHDMTVVERLCRRVHVLADGTLVESGTLRELLAEPSHPWTRGLAEALPLAHRPNLG